MYGKYYGTYYGKYYGNDQEGGIMFSLYSFNQGMF